MNNRWTETPTTRRRRQRCRHKSAVATPCPKARYQRCGRGNGRGPFAILACCVLCMGKSRQTSVNFSVFHYKYTHSFVLFEFLSNFHFFSFFLCRCLISFYFQYLFILELFLFCLFAFAYIPSFHVLCSK